MTAQDIQLIDRSFARMARSRVRFSQNFYGHLFAAAPELRAMFARDMTAQATKFVDMVALIVGQLRHPVALAATLDRLGRSHAQLGVTDRHHALVEDALAQTVRDALVEAWTPEVDAAWRALYGRAAAAMRRAA